MNFPSFDEQFSFLNQFILELVDDYHTGGIDSWGTLDEKVKSFFTPERMEQTETLVPGWKKMSSYSDGITLTHVMCVFLGVFLMPEFQKLTPEQQQLAKWIVLFHDVEKIHVRGKRDLTHGFRSAVLAGNALSHLGFSTSTEFKNIIDSWSEFTNSATIFSDAAKEEIQDNGKLSGIVSGIGQMYGKDSPAALIVKGVLFHMSLNVVKDWPQSAPLNDMEIKKYIDGNLALLLKVMCLADNEGWTMFYPETRASQREETLAAFDMYENMISQSSATNKFINDTQTSYDIVASEYADRFKDEMDDKPFDRECLDRLAREVSDLGPICDMGCGPGQIARYLHRKGAPTLGVDLSPSMIAEAQRLNPEIHFHTGNMLSLPDADHSWGGIAAFYCIIHIPREHVVDALREMKRVLKPNGLLLIAFHIGEEIKHLDEWWEKSVNVDFAFYLPGEMEAWLKEAGFELVETLVREPNPKVEYESRRAYLFARKPA